MGADTTPHLIVLSTATTDVPARVAAIRACRSPLSAVPIAVVGEPVGAGDVDDHLDLRWSVADAVALLERWRPESLATLTRMEAVLGDAAVADLLHRLRAQLERALATDRPDDRIAHRLGGISGMLGFTALGEAWLDVEAGGAGAERAARRATRRALAAIARRLG